MLYLELQETSHEILSNRIRGVCTEYGDVVQVQICGTTPMRAMVEMATPIDALRLRLAIGEYQNGRFVTIQLMQSKLTSGL